MLELSVEVYGGYIPSSNNQTSFEPGYTEFVAAIYSILSYLGVGLDMITQ